MLVAGIDVGGRRKGFHGAIIDGPRLVDGPTALPNPSGVVEWLRPHGVALVAVDSPVVSAPEGRKWRWGERQLAEAICGIRWTPDMTVIGANPGYYGWILQGFELYAELRKAGIRAIECFPTATWTRVAGRRRGTRARWTSEALPSLGLVGLAGPLNQDGRDALAAAVTARLHTEGLTESFGEIVVPVRGLRKGMGG